MRNRILFAAVASLMVLGSLVGIPTKARGQATAPVATGTPNSGTVPTSSPAPPPVFRTGYTCSAGYALVIESNWLTCKKTTTTTVQTATNFSTPNCSLKADIRVQAGRDYCSMGTPECPPGATYQVDGSGATDLCSPPVYKTTSTTDYQGPVLRSGT